MEILLYVCLFGIALLAVLLIVVHINDNKKNEAMMNELKMMKQELSMSTQSQVNSLSNVLSDSQKTFMELQNMRLQELNQSMSSRQDVLAGNINTLIKQMDERMLKVNELNTSNNELVRRQLFETSNQLEEKVNVLTKQNEEKMEQMRITLEQKITEMQADNGKRLEEMRNTVDEKLQDTLEKRISKSFQLVSERLEQVYKGLGEMQTLANGVGDLKKVLGNVKTRGILGEIQLGAILKEILAPEQFEENVATKKGSKNVVEFAIKMPADNDRFVYLPIDSKFPGDTYVKLLDAYDTGDKDKVAAAGKLLDTAIKQNAKDIHDKYIDAPNTTDFAIMFLPFEGLYAEVVRRGLIEILQRDYKINIAGPTTMAALLNSLQMGFKTLAIQKRSSEVWDVLGAVKTEFEKFGDVLTNTQSKLDLAQKELDKLVGVRTRQIQKRLSSVTSLDESASAKMIENTVLISDEEEN